MITRRAFLENVPLLGCVACLWSGLGAGPSALAKTQPKSQSGRLSRALPIIDVHTHCIDPSMLGEDARAQLNARPGLLNALTRPDIHIERMKALGLARHVVTQGAAIQGITWGDARRDLDVHRRVNDHIAERWVGEHPHHFYGGFGAPSNDLGLALPEVERMALTSGMKVLQVSSQTADGRYYGDPSLDPLLEALQHFGIALFIHPHLQMRDPPLNDFGLFNSVGQGIEEAKVMANIIFQGVFEKFPRLNIIVAHGGGFLPHYSGRMDRNITNIPGSGRNLKRMPSEYLKSFYYDSCVYGSSTLAALVKVVGADRVLLGGDYPLGVPNPVTEIRGATSGRLDVERILSGGSRLFEAKSAKP